MPTSIPTPLAQALQAGQVVPFVGAGASRAVRHRHTGQPLFPNWRELLEHGADAIARDRPNDAQLVRSYLQIHPPKYLEAAEHLRAQMPGSQWASWLRKHIDPPHEHADQQSLALARRLWDLGSPLIITTNYDRVLHWACPKSHNLQRWDKTAVAELAELLRAGTPARPTVWHLHGHIDNVHGLILTPDSFRRFYASPDRSDDLAREYSAALQTLRGLMASRTLLFIGFSLDDAYLGMHLAGMFELFHSYAGHHYVLTHRDEAERVRPQNLPVKPVVFEDFGEPLHELLDTLGGLARGDSPSRPPSAPPPPPPPATAPPPGGRYQPDWYIARPHVEQNALRGLEYGDPVLLWGSCKQGCSWVSRHVARAWHRQAPDSRHMTVVDFRNFAPGDLKSLDACLQEVARVVADRLFDDPGDIAGPWQASLGSAKTRINRFIKKQVLDELPGEHLLVLERADRVHGQPYYENFAGLLRSWAEKANEQRAPWDRLRLVVSVSTQPTRLHTRKHESPFANLSEPIHVGDFNDAQVKELVQRYDPSWTAAQIQQLMDVVGGHPYLICVVLVDTLDKQYTLEELAAGAPLGPSNMRDHLNRHRERLGKNPALASGFASLARDPRAAVDQDTIDELVRLGLIARRAGGHGLRYPLFERLL